MIDDRPKEIIEKYPLRKIQLDMCKCGHGDEDHQTEFDRKLGVKDGECSKCYCDEFILPTDTGEL